MLPQAKVQEETQLIPGTDGEKMSKSRGNFINIFLPEKKLRKQFMSISTDSKGVDDILDPDSCNVFSLYKLLANSSQMDEMRNKYASKGFGYGHAKQELYELVLERFKTERSEYDRLMANPSEIIESLEIGAKKARLVAHSVISKVRAKTGY